MKKIALLALLPSIAMADMYPGATIIDNVMDTVETKCLPLASDAKRYNEAATCFAAEMGQMGDQLAEVQKSRPPRTREENQQFRSALRRVSTTSKELRARLEKTSGTPTWPSSMTDAQIENHPLCTLLKDVDAQLDQCASIPTATDAKKCAEDSYKGLYPALGLYGEPPRGSYRGRFKDLCGMSGIQQKIRRLTE